MRSGAKLTRVLCLLRRGITAAGDAEEMFEELLGLFDAAAVLLADGWDAPRWHLHRHVPESWNRDHARLAHEDPSVDTLAKSPAGTWWCHGRDLTAPEGERELLRCFDRTGLTDAAIVRLYSPFRDDLLFAFYLEGRKFSSDELDTLQLLYPHIAAACATRRALALVQGSSTGPEAPVVHVGFPGGHVSISPAARNVIEGFVGSVSEPGWMRIERALAATAARFAFGHVSVRSHVLWPGLRVDFAIVPPETGQRTRLAGFLVQEQVGPEDVGWAAPPPLAAALLSPRELKVAGYFAAGMDLPSIAAELRIGEETARTHLRGAYRKLRVSDRAALVRVLAAK